MNGTQSGRVIAEGEKSEENKFVGRWFIKFIYKSSPFDYNNKL